MNVTECQTITANIVIGGQRGFSGESSEVITLEEFKKAVLKEQKEINSQLSVLLSANISKCEIIFHGMEEPSYEIKLIRYPEFLSPENKWREGVISFTKKLMEELDQKRTVIVFPDKTMMLETTGEIDPKVDV